MPSFDISLSFDNSTLNILISHFLDHSNVTAYNIVFKYFSIITIVYSIIIAPFWTGFADAYHRNDWIWIKRLIYKLNILTFLLLGVIIGMVAASGWFYGLWLGNKINTITAIPLSLSVLMGVYVFQSTLTSPFVFFMNGVGKIRLQLIISVFTSLANIPLAYYLIKKMGINGAILSPILCILPFTVFIIIQYKLIANHKAKGIWNK